MNTKTLFILLLLAGSIINIPMIYAAVDHDKNSHKTALEETHGGNNEPDEHEEKGTVILTEEQMQAAGIVVQPLQPELMRSVINAPGEVTFNTYKTASVAPRIAAQVIGCFVALGETVRPGQSIVTLSSVEMAEAQGALLIADREWNRVKKLGRNIVAESRYTETKVNWELAKGKVKAYGMTDSQINDLLTSEDFSRANGRFELLASHGGTVLMENYILGQLVEPGHELIRITNEASLWVVANVPSSVANQISIGSNASIHFDEQTLPATVIQKYHSLNETTRTSGIRLAVENKNHELHPGMFVNAQIETSTESKALALPEEAVLRSPDGDWMVMTQTETGEFKSQEVELLRVSNGRAVISGIKPGTPVVIKGSFFVWSESAKAGFDAHDH